ncbi:thymidylate synthase, partial [Streptococcus danieliae]|nr:thymidylate synthase [Streptococcus danieliae]
MFADKEYLKLCNHIMDEGFIKKDRTGVGTKSVFGYQMKFDL